MANMASNQMKVISGSEEDIKKMYLDLSESTDVEVVYEECSGRSREEWERLRTIKFLLGYVDFSAEADSNDVWFETKWSYPDGLVESLFEMYNVGVSVQTEEMGSGIYEYHDFYGNHIYLSGEQIDSAYDEELDEIDWDLLESLLKGLIADRFNDVDEVK